MYQRKLKFFPSFIFFKAQTKVVSVFILVGHLYNTFEHADQHSKINQLNNI